MQSPDTVLMVEPVAFAFNAQTALDNYFQVNRAAEHTQTEALKEFKAFVEHLKSNGINVFTIKDTLEPHTPDSIFPNNWVSFHEDGTVVLYPMLAENRRLERRNDILTKISEANFKISTIKDYSPFEVQNKCLEGTGSMILDHVNKIAYGALSLRLDKGLFEKWCKEFGYRPIVFTALQSVNGKRLPIYHTNTMMCVGTDYAVIGLDTIDNKEERALVEKTLIETKKEIIEITEEQVHNFAGNMLEVRNNENKMFLVMSERAYKNLTPKQIQRIQGHAEIIYADVSTIEDVGGGSTRCMMAEIFLPKI